MPWSRLRANKPSENGSRQSTIIVDPPALPNPGTFEKTNGIQSEPHPGTKVPSPLRRPIDVSHDEDGAGQPGESSPDLDSLEPPSKKRFSMLKYRHASDPQISRTAKEQAPSVPPATTVPVTITASKHSFDKKQERTSMLDLPRRITAPDRPRQVSAKSSQISLPPQSNSSMAPEQRESMEAPRGPADTRGRTGAVSGPSVPPVPRFSESSRSEGSTEHRLYAATTTTTHTVSTTTTFFRLPRRKKKDKGPLFPLPPRVTPSDPSPSRHATPRGSTSARPSESPRRPSIPRSPTRPAIRKSQDPDSSSLDVPLAAGSQRNSEPALSAQVANLSTSGRASPAVDATKLGRSPTRGSLRVITDDEGRGFTNGGSGRTSSSTAGRSSLGGVFTLSRLRQDTEQPGSRQATPIGPSTPLTAGSKPHSFSLAREPVAVPEREEGETAAKYLIRLEENVSRHIIASVVSQKNDEFFKNVLRSYMRGFKFFGEPLDMAVRKMLMEVDLPKETQHIDRVLQAFANRYHECNPGVFASPDEAYFIAFSILILHTDVFNKNNKNKMQKSDYTKNTRGQGVAEEILECFYDNISYTPFIHVEGDLEATADRAGARKLKKNLFSKQSTDSQGKPSREPVDPYTIILDGRLDTLRPPLKDVMNLEDHYNYLGTAPSLNLFDLSRTFFRSGVLQIVSSRSRPEAFTSPETMANPAEAHPGVVDMKVTKVGILWRKDVKKKKTRSPWQEWGCILTGASLYFFRNASWIKGLMQQHDSHHRHNWTGKPCIFKPPLEQFKPDVLMPTNDAVALVDTTYKRHKNALIFIRHGGVEETFLADSESEMNDWLAKMNFASAFSTAGVPIRESPIQATKRARQQMMQRQDSHNSDESAELITPTLNAIDDRAAADLAQRVRMARQRMLTQKIAEAGEKLADAHKQLEAQLRNARHLQILAPIQIRTREQIVLAAGGMAAKVKWMRLDIWRMTCHRDILAKDLEEDLRSTEVLRKSGPPELTSNSPGGTMMLPISSSDGPTTPARRLSRPHVLVRPATQPSPEKSFNMDDVFAPMSTSPQGRSGTPGPRTSWELPPLSFQPTKTSLASGSTSTSLQPSGSLLKPQPSSRSLTDVSGVPETSNAGLIEPATTATMGTAEHEVLRESGVLNDQSAAAQQKSPQTPDTDDYRDGEKFKGPDPDFSESRSKVRRSLHRTLRDSSHTAPMHHRSKKGKDSAGSAVAAEDSIANGESESLQRSTGSFTVHGKKASVITFGSEWQSISPDERLSLRKQNHADGGNNKLSVPFSLEDGSTPRGLKPTAANQERPISGVSASTNTTTTKSTAFEEALEEPLTAPEEESKA